MKPFDVNSTGGCYGCTYADALGENCSQGSMPFVVVMADMEQCPKYKPKTDVQLQEQREYENDMAMFGDYDLCRGLHCAVRDKCLRYQPMAKGLRWVFDKCYKRKLFKSKI
jgi:hypothetical protein